MALRFLRLGATAFGGLAVSPTTSVGPPVRHLVRAGIPERIAMQMTGHETRSVFERYNAVSAGDLREAAKRLDAATGTISRAIEQDQPAPSRV